MLEMNTVNIMNNTLNEIEKLRNRNEKERDRAQRNNNLKTAAKAAVVASAVPLTISSVILSNVDMDEMNVTYHIPKFMQKSKTLTQIGMKIDEGMLRVLEKTSALFKKPKAYDLIEKTDTFVGNIAEKAVKSDNDLKYLHGGMTSLGLKALGVFLFAGIAVKHFVNRHKINKEYHAKQARVHQYEMQAVKKQLDEIQNL